MKRAWLAASFIFLVGNQATPGAEPCSDCQPAKEKNCLRRVWEWLTYQPLERPCKACCGRAVPYCNPPLCTYFPCHGETLPPYTLYRPCQPTCQGRLIYSGPCGSAGAGKAVQRSADVEPDFPADESNVGAEPTTTGEKLATAPEEPDPPKDDDR